MIEEPYTPISCSFYDRLEEAATLSKNVLIEYLANNKTEVRKSIITTIRLKDKIEWLVLEDGSEIRLDRILSLDGVELKTHC